MDAGGHIQFGLADASHEPALRRLLRESAIGGDIQLSIHREPNYFNSVEKEHAESHTIVAMQRDRAVCIGSIGIRHRYLNGESQRVAYLGQLRLAKSHHGRFDILCRGFRLFRTLLSQLGVAACFTSIAIDNVRAMRFLESGVRGLPTYRPIGELVTLAVPLLGTSEKEATDALRVMTGQDIEAFKTFLDTSGDCYQLAPHWSVEQLRFLFETNQTCGVLATRDGLPVCGALLWDQRCFKQTVVAGYSTRLRLLRPVYNVVARLARKGRLPKQGTELAAAFIAVLATTSASDCLHLLQGLSTSAKRKGLDYLMIGFDRRDPRLHVICNSVRSRQYRTVLYQLDWPAENLSHVSMDDRLLFPDVALL